MLCQICKKNPAAVHLQEIKNGKRSVLHLCLECAGKRALPQGELFDGLNIADLLKTFEAEINRKSVPEEETPEKQLPPCPVCMWRLEDLRKTGFFGCPECYTHFKDLAAERLLELNNATIHTGRIPACSGDLFYTEDTGEFGSLAKEQAGREALAREIEELQQDIDGSIRREEYELAAQLRDRLQLLLTKTR